jgi:hypothetical protein
MNTIILMANGNAGQICEEPKICGLSMKSWKELDRQLDGKGIPNILRDLESYFNNNPKVLEGYLNGMHSTDEKKPPQGYEH